mmetsp:Transcript_9707/g.21694  ORF Transcript_9707/g.21694 Transcript_9707/m.21694 type:complete len:215 (+) Transcript_9707:5296-5940(+)
MASHTGISSSHSPFMSGAHAGEWLPMRFLSGLAIMFTDILSMHLPPPSASPSSLKQQGWPLLLSLLWMQSTKVVFSEQRASLPSGVFWMRHALGPSLPPPTFLEPAGHVTLQPQSSPAWHPVQASDNSAVGASGATQYGTFSGRSQMGPGTNAGVGSPARQAFFPSAPPPNRSSPAAHSTSHGQASPSLGTHEPQSVRTFVLLIPSMARKMLGH